MKIFLPLFFTLLVLSLAIGFPRSYYAAYSSSLGASFSLDILALVFNIIICMITACLGFIIIRSYRNAKASR